MMSLWKAHQGYEAFFLLSMTVGHCKTHPWITVRLCQPKHNVGAETYDMEAFPLALSSSWNIRYRHVHIHVDLRIGCLRRCFSSLASQMMSTARAMPLLHEVVMTLLCGCSTRLLHRTLVVTSISTRSFCNDPFPREKGRTSHA